jgi:glycosyltransferase involved in cell wall biosynthesis
VTAETPLVSVIVTSYNQASFLGDAINSVQAQSHRSDEIIVVDDGSSDDTFQVAMKYPEVKCIRSARKGLSGARNTGISESKGSFLVFLDADDRLLPEALDRGLSSLSTHAHWGFVAGHYTLIDARGERINSSERPCVIDGSYESLLRRNHIGMHATVMYRRDVIKHVGGFNTSLNACEDYDLYLRVAREFAFGCHHHLVAEYRQHGANMSNDAALMIEASVLALRSQLDHVRGNPSHEKAYRSGLQYWRNYYGSKLIEQASRQWRARNWKSLSTLSFAIARHHPAGFVAHFIRKLGLSVDRSKELVGGGIPASNSTESSSVQTSIHPD